MKEQRNVDGDTLADLVRAQSDCNNAAALENSTTSGWTPCVHLLSGNRNVLHYRITAKHADRFDKDCMSFETWARAVEKRGKWMTGIKIGCACRCKDAIEAIYKYQQGWSDYTWTAIPRAKAPASPLVGATMSEAHGDLSQGVWFQSAYTGLWYRSKEAAGDLSAWCEDGILHQLDVPEAPAAGNEKLAGACGAQHDSRAFHHCLFPAGHAGRHYCHICGLYWGEGTGNETERCHIHAVNSYLQPLWELMHNEHGLTLLQTELQDIMAACKKIEQADEMGNMAEIAELKDKLKQVHKDLGHELRDPNGTIWQECERLQKENEQLKAKQAAGAGGEG